MKHETRNLKKERCAESVTRNHSKEY